MFSLELQLCYCLFVAFFEWVTFRAALWRGRSEIRLRKSMIRFSGSFQTLSPQTLLCELYLSQRECVCVSTSGKSRWIPAADGHNGQSWQKVNYAESKESILKSYDTPTVYKEFYPPQCQSHFPFSGGHQTFVSDLLTCQKQHNLRTKCGIIYAEKETSDMKRDKKKKLTG